MSGRTGEFFFFFPNRVNSVFGPEGQPTAQTEALLKKDIKLNDNRPQEVWTDKWRAGPTARTPSDLGGLRFRRRRYPRAGDERPLELGVHGPVRFPINWGSPSRRPDRAVPNVLITVVDVTLPRVSKTVISKDPYFHPALSRLLLATELHRFPTENLSVSLKALVGPYHWPRTLHRTPLFRGPSPLSLAKSGGLPQEDWSGSFADRHQKGEAAAAAAAEETDHLLFNVNSSESFTGSLPCTLRKHDRQTWEG